MPRRIGNDEFAFFGGKESIGHINRDALFALGNKTVDQQREIYVLPLGADLLAVRLQRGQLIFKYHL